MSGTGSERDHYALYRIDLVWGNAGFSDSCRKTEKHNTTINKQDVDGMDGNDEEMFIAILNGRDKEVGAWHMVNEKEEEF